MNNKEKVYTNNIPKKLITTLGLKAASVFTKIHYWCYLTKSGKEIPSQRGLWVYNTLEQWVSQFEGHGISNSTLRRILTKLKELDFVFTHSERRGSVLFYTVNPEKVIEFFPEKMYGKIIKFLDKKAGFFVPENELTHCSNSSHPDVILSNAYINIHNTTQNNTNSSIERLSQKLEKTEVEVLDFSKEIVEVKNQDEIYNEIEQPALTQKSEIAEKMMQVWKEEFDKSNDSHVINVPILDQRVKRTLLNLWKNVFGESMERWIEYTTKIRRSKWLMGETSSSFKAYFDYLMNPSVITTILHPDYKQDRIINVGVAIEVRTGLQSGYQNYWNECKKLLIETYKSDAIWIENWVNELEIKVDGNTVFILTQDTKISEVEQQKYLNIITALWKHYDRSFCVITPYTENAVRYDRRFIY